METTQQSPKIMSSLIKGFLISLIIIVLQTIAQLANLHNEPWFKLIPFLLLIIGLIWSCTYYGKQMQHQVSFGNVFGHGFKTTSAIALVMIIYSILMLTVISPELKEQAIQQAYSKMVKDGKLSVDTIEKSLQLVKKFFIPLTIGTMLLIYAFIGLIASLIGAAVTKKNPISTP